MDKLVHRFAFAFRGVQLAAADIEGAMFRNRYQNIALEEPIFITSLPRAGTTLLLEMLGRCTGSATHRYRDMPFVLAPMLWEALTGSFRKTADLHERAHADGMLVGFDSPEAFEEVVWRYFWPEKYHADGIELWSSKNRDEEFECFLRQHMQKIIALRVGVESSYRRYVSKNNANISRLGLLKEIFPDCELVVPFRNPLFHAASLLKQHANFIEIHRRDAFSRRYMEDIGHLEFGELHRTIRFGKTMTALKRLDPKQLDYWIAYWIAAFEHIVEYRDQITLVSYEQLCSPDAAIWGSLTDRLGIIRDDNWQAARAMIREPKARGLESEAKDKKLLNRAIALHDQLLFLVANQ